jgi:hypothetical protein
VVPQCNGSGYSCLVPKCGNLDTGTTVSGTVFDPSGKNPVYGAVVYIPDQPDQISDITQGPGNLCGRCVQPSGSPIAGAVTGPDGSFVIKQTPVGRQIPIVVQLGKWRRMSFVDINNACADNPLGDPDLTRLPRSRGDGKKASLPKIAIAAGAADRLQCLLLRMGVDASEFTNPDGPGSVNLYNQPPALGSDPSGRYDPGINSGAAFPDAAAFWSDINELAQYDVVLLACAGNQAATDPTRTTPNPITDAAKASLVKYLASGGRVLGEHYNGPGSVPIPPKSDSQSGPRAVAPRGRCGQLVSLRRRRGRVELGGARGDHRAGAGRYLLPKGRDFAQWLVAAKAAQALGTLPLVGDIKRTAIDELAGLPSAQRWLYQPASAADPTGRRRLHPLSQFQPDEQRPGRGSRLHRRDQPVRSLRVHGFARGLGRYQHTRKRPGRRQGQGHAFPKLLRCRRFELVREGHGVHVARLVRLPVAGRGHDRQSDRLLAIGIEALPIEGRWIVAGTAMKDRWGGDSIPIGHHRADCANHDVSSCKDD